MSSTCSAPGVTGVSLTTDICNALSNARTEKLQGPTIIQPTLVADSLMPIQLKQALTDCVGSSSCRLIGYDFDTNTAAKASASRYVIDTYSSSSENTGVLVFKGNKTSGTISGITPNETGGGSTGTVMYTVDDGQVYTFQGSWRSVLANGTTVDVYFDPGNKSRGALNPRDLGFLPPTLVEPPGYELPDFQSAVVTTANKIATPTVSSVEECAAQCDTTSGCSGFNFGGIDTNTICELVNDTTTREYRDATSGFRKEIISATQTGDGSNPSGTDLSNEGEYCRNVTACNTDIARIITENVGASNPIAAFSTNDLESCAYCPIRTYATTGNVTTNELGVSKSNPTPAAAVSELQFSADGTSATHMTIVHGSTYRVRKYKAPPFANRNTNYTSEADISVAVSINTDGRFEFFKLNRADIVDRAYPSSYGYTDAVRNTSFALLPCDYVTNGFRLENQDGDIFIEGPLVNYMGYYTNEDIKGYSFPKYSPVYNATIFIFESITFSQFINKTFIPYPIYSYNNFSYKLDVDTLRARKFVDQTMIDWYTELNLFSFNNRIIVRRDILSVFWDAVIKGYDDDMPDPYEALGLYRTLDVKPPSTSQSWAYDRRQGCNRNCGNIPNGYAIYDCDKPAGSCDPGKGVLFGAPCSGTHISCRPADDSADLKAQFSFKFRGLLPSSTKVISGGSNSNHNTDSLRIRTLYSFDSTFSVSTTPDESINNLSSIFPSFVISRIAKLDPVILCNKVPTFGYYCPGNGQQIPCPSFTCPAGQTLKGSCGGLGENLIEGAYGDTRRCEPCPFGYYCPSAGQRIACPNLYCPPGQAVVSGACGDYPVPGGNTADTRVCGVCPAGSWARSSSSNCIDCATTAPKCPAGQYVTGSCGGTSDNRICSPCPDGSYCPGDGTARSCTITCPAGQGASGVCGGAVNNRSCIPCPVVTCPQGQYISGVCDGSGITTTCTFCVDGKTYCPGDGIAHLCPVLSCPAGQYITGECKWNGNTSQCTPLTPGSGFYAPGDNSVRQCTTGCGQGNYLSSQCTTTSDAVCSPCPANSYSFGTGSSCTPCGPPPVCTGSQVLNTGKCPEYQLTASGYTGDTRACVNSCDPVWEEVVDGKCKLVKFSMSFNDTDQTVWTAGGNIKMTKPFLATSGSDSNKLYYSPFVPGGKKFLAMATTTPSPLYFTYKPATGRMEVYENSTYIGPFVYPTTMPSASYIQPEDSSNLLNIIIIDSQRSIPSQNKYLFLSRGILFPYFTDYVTAAVDPLPNFSPLKTFYYDNALMQTYTQVPSKYFATVTKIPCKDNYYYNSACVSTCPSAASFMDGQNCVSICPAGTYSAAGSKICTSSPAGTFSAAGATSYTPCGAGSWSSSRSSSCTSCPSGTYFSGSSATTSAVCSPCNAGSVPASDASKCNSCPTGTFAATAGLAMCTPCADGYTTSGGGQTSCYACPAGKKSRADHTYCDECPVGTYSPTAGSTSCTACSAGTITAAPGQTSCTACPSGASSENRSYCLIETIVYPGFKYINFNKLQASFSLTPVGSSYALKGRPNQYMNYNLADRVIYFSASAPYDVYVKYPSTDSRHLSARTWYNLSYTNNGTYYLRYSSGTYPYTSSQYIANSSDYGWSMYLQDGTNNKVILYHTSSKWLKQNSSGIPIMDTTPSVYTISVPITL